MLLNKVLVCLCSLWLTQCFVAHVGTKGFSDSGESGLGDTGGTAGAVAVQKQL